MRSDKQLNPRFTGSERWTFDRGTGGNVTNVIKNPDGSENVWTAFSHSGTERNRVLMNQGGKGFVNVSGVSGADSVLDGRSWVIWDHNRDGRSDIAVVNANERLLQIFENRADQENGFVAIRLTGGMGSVGGSGGYSNRDAIGARITVETEKGSIMRTLSGGEGFAAQNSKTILVGVGLAKGPCKVKIDWPSGRVTVAEGVLPGDLVEFIEISGKNKFSRYSGQ